MRPWRNGDDPFEASDIVAGIAATGDPAVVCVGDDVPLDLALQVATVADRDHRADMSVVLIAEPSADLWRDAVRAGVRDVVAPTTLDDELGRALGRALDWTARLGDHKVVADNTPTTGRVIVVLSPKGGSGKTMLSSNLTAALAGAVDGPVALVDLDVQFGDTAFALGLVARAHHRAARRCPDARLHRTEGLPDPPRSLRGVRAVRLRHTRRG